MQDFDLRKWFSSTKKAKESPKFNSLEDYMLDIDEFNKWFIDPDNGAVYANPGIFLRTSKLSPSHIEDFLLKKYNVDPNTISYEKLQAFLEAIGQNWRSRQ